MFSPHLARHSKKERARCFGWPCNRGHRITQTATHFRAVQAHRPVAMLRPGVQLVVGGEAEHERVAGDRRQLRVGLAKALAEANAHLPKQEEKATQNLS